MKKILVITNIQDLSIPLFLTQEVQQKINTEFYFFHEKLITLEKKLVENCYDYVYFGYPFRYLDKNTLEKWILIIQKNKKDAYIIDNICTIDDLYFEDKWKQYQLYAEYMPHTHLLSTMEGADNTKFITKERISGRAEGIFFDSKKLDKNSLEKYILQEIIPIKKEYRIYVVCNEIMPIATVRSPKTPTTKVKIIGSEKLSAEILAFVQKVIKKNTFDLIGLDIATDGSNFYLIEINRACLFSGYYVKTKVNLAKVLIDKLIEYK